MAENNFLQGLAQATPSLLGGAISAAGSVWSQSWQNKFNREEAEKQRVWNEAMVDKQNAFSLDMWDKTNEYNSPAAQIKRLQDAGLNPLYYGLDGSSANSFQSAQPLGYDRASMSGVDNPMAVGVNAAAQVAQTKLAYASYFSRMAPLVKPTYGKFSFKTVSAFVPYHMLANDAEAWLAGKTTWEGVTPHQRYITMYDLAFFIFSTCLGSSVQSLDAADVAFTNNVGNAAMHKLSARGK